MVMFLAVLTLASLGSGLGFGWATTLNTANPIKSWMAPMTALGFGAGGLGIILGLGNHIDAAITVSRMVGTLLGPLLAAKLLLDSFRWRLRPMIGLGAALGAVLVFGATVQPWYLLWAAIPLASAAGNTRFRTAATAISAAFAVALPPTGTTFDGRTYQLPYAYIAAAIVVVIALVLVRRHVPTRPRRKARKAEPDAGVTRNCRCPGLASAPWRTSARRTFSTSRPSTARWPSCATAAPSAPAQVGALVAAGRLPAATYVLPSGEERFPPDYFALIDAAGACGDDLAAQFRARYLAAGGTATEADEDWGGYLTGEFRRLPPLGHAGGDGGEEPASSRGSRS